MTCSMRESDLCILTSKPCLPDSDAQKTCGLYRHTKGVDSAAKAIAKGKVAKPTAESWDTAPGGNGSKPPTKPPKKKKKVAEQQQATPAQN